MLTQPQAVLLGAATASVVALVGHGLNAWRDHVARRHDAKERRREREEDLRARRSDNEVRYRHRADDYQRQTLVDVQETLGDLLESAFEAAILASIPHIPRKPGDAPDRAELIEARKPIARYQGLRAKAFALTARVCDQSARRAAMDALKEAEAARNVVGNLEGLQESSATAFVRFVTFCGRAGELIRAIDAGEPAELPEGTPPGSMPSRAGEDPAVLRSPP
jgi:hypothetical protein